MAAVVAQPMTAGQEQLPLAPGSATERAASCPVETPAAAAPAERQLSCPVEFSAEPVPAKAEEDTKDVDDGKEDTKEDDTAKDPADVGESSMITGLVEKPGSAQLRDAAPPREDANGDEAIKHIDDGKEAADKGDLDQGANGKNVNDVGESAEITGLVEKPCSAQLRDAAPPRPITGGTKNVTPISAG